MHALAVPRRVGAMALAAALSLAALPAVAADVAIGSLVLENPHSRATPPGARVGAGYLTIHNRGPQADRLVAVACACAEAAEIHEMSMVDNVMRMRHRPDGLEIPAGGSVELKPGGYHLMFVGLKHPLVAGETVEATLTFAGAGAVAVPFAIDPLRPMPGHGKPAN